MVLAVDLLVILEVSGNPRKSTLFPFEYSQKISNLCTVSRSVFPVELTGCHWLKIVVICHESGAGCQGHS